ncbi:MAG TPA: 30S ribosomal protein S12 methylthiotransferase RimO [Candidatus Deferrimicrobium sp.]|nr:30S ribosomal protein S12 methylthiotransferase RimO [Candidatus Deferrimicrobium sp.]
MEKQKITASFISLGCFKNIVDTEVLGGMLEKYNIRIVSSYEDSDWIIINTCGFIREAKEEGIEEILAALEKKESGETKHVAIFGCLTQRYYEELKANFKKADIIWGVNDLDQLASLIANEKKEEYRNKNLFLYDENHNRIITTTPNTTFIKISEGCNMYCSFCAIPQIRGPFRSRSIDSIIEEARKYKEMEFQEINLISQNSTYFGKDRGPKSQLPELLKEISTLGFNAVRVLYMMPEEVTDEIIAAFSYPTIIPYFDLPFQHVSPTILKRMNRGGSSEKNLTLIKKIREKYPEAIIRSSFIVGFPGETKAEFKELLEFAVKSEIERLGVFGYSDEENTDAFKLKKKNSQVVIETRKETLMDISDRNMEIYNKKITGTEQDFLPHGPSPWSSGSTIGRIKSQAPETDGFTQVNEPFEDDYHMFKIKITGFQHEMLYGERL